MADPAPAFDDLPSFDDLPGSPAGGGAPAWDALPSFDDLPDQRPQAESPLASAGREAAHGVVPAAAGLVGMGAGAAIGAPAGPLGSIAGGIVGGVAASLGANFGQEKILNAFGHDDSEQRRANVEENKWSSFAGGMAPALVGMSPVAGASKLAPMANQLVQRGAGAGFGGAMEAGGELYNEGHVDPAKVAAAATAGAVLPGVNRVGAKFVGAGERMVPGRPGRTANPAADEAHADVGDPAPSAAPDPAAHAQEQSRYADALSDPEAMRQFAHEEGLTEAEAREVAQANYGLPQKQATIGNPQSAPARSAKTYPKDNAQAEPQDNMLTQGDMDPATRSAMESWLGESPDGTPPAPLTVSSSELPVKTGIEEAGAAQAQTKNANDVFSQLQAKKPVEAPPVEAQPHVEEQPRVETGIEEAAKAPPWEELPAGNEPVMTGTARKNPDGSYSSGDGASSIVFKAPGESGRVIKGEPHPTPSDAQINANNFKKGRTRFAGREVAIETAEGGIRRSKADAPEPWEVKMPYDYGDIKGTKGADGDPVDIGFGKGNKHFVIDQRDANTGKFDEHKVMADFKSEADALTAYRRGFSDNRGRERMHHITEVSETEIQDWLANGDMKKPFKGGMLGGENRGTPGTALGKPTPKVVTATVKALRETGDPAHAKVADAIEAMPREKQVVEAARANAALTNRTGKVPDAPKNPRIRPKPPTLKVGDTEVTGRTLADVERKKTSLDAVRNAFEKATPTENEGPAALVRRLQDAVGPIGKEMLYKPRVPPAEWLWAREARRLLQKTKDGGVAPSQREIDKFISNEKLLRSGRAEDVDIVRGTNRIDSDIAMSRRSGDDAIADAENKNARFDIPHEEAESMVEPTPVKTAEDLKELPRKTLDMTTPKGQRKAAEALGVIQSEAQATRAAKAKESAERTRLLLESRKNAQKTEATPAEREKVKVTEDLNKKYLEQLAVATAKEKSRAAPEITAPEDLKTPAAKDLFEKFLNDERGELNIDKMWADVVESFRHKAPKSYIARTARTPQEQYARSLSDQLQVVRQQDIDHKVGLLRKLESLPKELNNAAALEKVYHAREAGEIGKLSPELQALYNEHLKPVFDQNDLLFKNIQDIAPEKIGPEVKDHIYRIIKGSDSEHNILKTGESNDPIEGANAITTSQRGPAMERRFVALERQDGKRFVISLNDDGFTIWKNRGGQKVVDPEFAFKAGEKLTVGNNTFTMKEAMTPEIEAHGRMDKGVPASYYHNAALSAAAANAYLGSMARHLQYLGNLKSDPEFRKFAAPPGAKGKDGWIETSLANFKGWKMDPQMAYVMDDFAQPGFNEKGLNTLRRLSQAVTKTIFWMPTAHINNVGAHWFVERGWNWITPEGTRSLAVNGAKSIKSVISQDSFQSELRQHGAGTIYGGVITQRFMEQVGKSIGESINNNPSKWDPIARTLGMGPSTLAKAVYRGSARVMWAANDMFLTQSVMEKMDAGMSMKDAIVAAERHIPNYRVPTTIMSGGQGGRIVAQIVSEPAFVAFGRYHYGVFNSYAHIVKDLVKGDGHQKLEAIGNLMALGILALAVKPVLDKASQLMTGNPDAEAQSRGPMAIPHHLKRAGEGKEDLMQGARSTVTLSPLLSTALETLANKDFRGKQIMEPGDVRRAAQGSLPAAGRVALGQAEHAARGLVSPIGTMETSSGKKQGPLETIRDQALDIRNPSPQSRKFEARAAKTSTQQSVARFKKPPGMAEAFYNRLVGY